MTMDPSSVLKDLSKRATRFSVNLDGQVKLDKQINSHGHSALVYHGILCQNGIKTNVAVKVFRTGAPGEDTLKRILREVHLWSKLSHENIVRMLGISTDFEFTISIISDWMPNGDAFSYVQNQMKDPRPLIMGIANGLRYLHSRDIFHGDLKGQNVLISHDGRALLADFGLSTLATSTFSMTVERHFGGTPRWMAPELLEGGEASVPGDVYALGMTALELFTRKPPFHEKQTYRSVIYRILQGPPDRPADESTCFRLTDPWWSVCSLCWDCEPSSRPEIPEIIQKLDKIMLSVEEPFTQMEPQVLSTTQHIEYLSLSSPHLPALLLDSSMPLSTSRSSAFPQRHYWENMRFHSEYSRTLRSFYRNQISTTFGSLLFSPSISLHGTTSNRLNGQADDRLRLASANIQAPEPRFAVSSDRNAGMFPFVMADDPGVANEYPPDATMEHSDRFHSHPQFGVSAPAHGFSTSSYLSPCRFRLLNFDSIGLFGHGRPCPSISSMTSIWFPKIRAIVCTDSHHHDLSSDVE